MAMVEMMTIAALYVLSLKRRKSASLLMNMAGKIFLEPVIVTVLIVVEFVLLAGVDGAGVTPTRNINLLGRQKSAKLITCA
ncbi:hypothetical protein A3724_00635 [Alcanivorax sp. HI0033]|nr:hypothetical protein A3713_08785 [Alcanivorax sp. HI0003]KZX65822.1 hypothetical protein A3714_14955 [Alcanivorax sp. HI0007]KZX73931.1 hypothetical protein A3716_12995 [Alcanivorax sp. HI0011]KZX85571.1 hypothetical protein A3717_06045 [Alcanivorax sp. HI0013]KZY06683.1 hypothetical protein A3724_00635 [Alcanivorax sp. HI0033]KZY11883.1 hypothetical protein A3725_14665 [Alcanivorax sp. HI0035]